MLEKSDEESFPPFRPIGSKRTYDPLFGISWKRGAGCWLFDSEGNRYLDCISGYSANNLGHANERVIDSIESSIRQMGWVIGGETDDRNRLERMLCDTMAQSVARTVGGESIQEQVNSPRKSGDQLKAWISTTGSRAIEIAWKVAYAVRPGRMVVFDLAFHGRSLATGLLSDTNRSGIAEGWSSVERLAPRSIPFPVADTSQTIEVACKKSLDIAQELFANQGEEISALLVEPAIGARGYYFAPHWYFRELTKLARLNGILLISDEIQMGLGRMGGWTGCEIQGWAPDLWVVGKSLGGGLIPTSAVVGPAWEMDALPAGVESETFAATPLSCAVGNRVLEILTDTNLIEESARRHRQLRVQLVAILGEMAVIGEGSATAIDFGSLSFCRDSGADFARCFVNQALQKGVLLHLTGPRRDRVAIIPPLLISDFELSFLIDALSSVWIAATQQSQRTLNS